MNHLLKILITEQVKAILREQEEDLAADDAGGGDMDLDLGGGDLDMDMGDGADAGDLGGDGDLDMEGGDLGGDAGGLEGDDLDGGDMDMGGGGMGDLGGGGGFGGGGGGDLGGGDDMGGEDSDTEGEETEEVEDDPIPDDPAQGVVDDVKAALESTQDPQVLLNVAKASVQKYFDTFEEATPILDLLRNDEDPILQDVGKRLGMFLKGF